MKRCNIYFFGFSMIFSLLVGCGKSTTEVSNINLEENVPQRIEIVDLSDAWDTILNNSTLNFIGGHPIDESFLAMVTANYGDEVIEEIASYANFDSPEVWYQLTGKSIHVLWYEYCNMTGLQSYAYDKSFAPEGKTVLQANIVQSDSDYQFWESLSKEEYSAKKAHFAEKVTKRIIREFPELEGKIELLDCWTPLTYNRYCNAYHGSYMGFVTTVGNKQMRFKGVVKGVDDLYIAGQWVMSPGGLPIAVVSGKFAVQRILKREKRSIDI